MARIALPFRFVIQYVQGAAREIRQVTWPTRTQLVQYTILVVATLIVAGAVLALFDYGLQQLTTRYLLR